MAKVQYREHAFRRYLECGILAYGFARAYCHECGHDFLIAFSCKGRGVCPSCLARRMIETAAHLIDHVVPSLPVRQWVISFPKRRRYFWQRDPAVRGAALRIVLRVIEQALKNQSPGASSNARIGAVAFIDQFGASLNEHTPFPICVIDGVFETAEDDTPALERIEILDDQRIIYHLPKPTPDGRPLLQLTPLEFLARIVALVPEPRIHRHRYYGVLAPHARLRPAVTALAWDAGSTGDDATPTSAFFSLFGALQAVKSAHKTP